MVRRYSAAFGSSAKAFDDAGVFNGFIEVDTKLYIDPHLLVRSSSREMNRANTVFKKYFSDVIKILRQSTNDSDVLWRQAVKKLTFQEIPQLSLGYSAGSVRGSAIGPKLAASIAKTAREIVISGIKEPELFEIIGLLEEGIGADRISDMTASVIINQLLGYSQRMTKKLKLKSGNYSFENNVFDIPFDEKTNRYVILLPKDILRRLPVANEWSEIDTVCRHNAILRRQVNQLIGKTWKKATTKVPKKELKAVLLDHPDALRDLLMQYKAKQGKAYDFKVDPFGEVSWYSATHNCADQFPLDLSRYKKMSAKQIYPLALELCTHFKKLIENNGLNDLLYKDKRKLKHERAAQLIFFGVADAYCEANNIDVNREPNAGSGPVDFKISYGYKAKVNIEIKYSNNTNLLNGFTKQLEAYNKAEKTSYSIFLVIQTGPHKRKIDKLKKLHKVASSGDERVPEIIVVNGQKRLSASKLR